MYAKTTLTCERCGLSWQRPRLGGAKAKVCPQCRYAEHPHRELPDLDVAKRLVDYRCAIELAKACLRTNRPTEALAALTQVDQP